MRLQLKIHKQVRNAFFATFAMSVLVILLSSSQAFAVTTVTPTPPAPVAPAPVTPAPVTPTPVTPAPVATFNFTNLTTTNKTFVVGFDVAMNAAEAQDPANYYITNTGSPDPLLSRADLIKAATITYNSTKHETTVVLTDPAIVIFNEQVSFGVRNVHATVSGVSIVETTKSAVIQIPPGMPGIPAVTSAVTNKQITWVWKAAIDGDPYPSGIGSYQYELLKDGVLVDKASGQTTGDVLSIVTPVAIDGNYSLRLHATDKANNVGLPITSTVVTIDTTGPTVVIAKPVLTGNTYQPVVSDPAELATYSWSAIAPATQLTVSSPNIAQPLFTFLVDGTYKLTLGVADALGNVTSQNIFVTYLAPYIAGSGDPITPVDPQPAPFTPTANVVAAKTTKAVANADIAYTDTPAITTTQTSAPLVASTATTPIVEPPPSAIVPSTQGWSIFGFLWYWWVALIAIIVTSWVLIKRYVSRVQVNDSP